MEEIKKNDIRSISTKVGLVNIIGFIIMFIPYLILYKFLNIDSNTPSSSLESIIVSTLPLYISLFIPSILILRQDSEDIFSGNNTSFNLSIKAKIKLTILFTSIYLFACIISTYIMSSYMKFRLGSDVADPPFLIGTPAEITYKLIYFGVMAPIIEEVIFRGIFTKKLKVGGSLFAIITSSFIFMIPHSIGFLHSFVAGLILGVCYILTGNIKWSIIFHIVCNFGITVTIGWFEILPSMNLNILRLALGIMLIIIFFIVAKKDNELKGLYKRINFKTVVTQLKRDKEKYKIFITTPAIIIYIVFSILRFIFGLI